MSRTTKRQHRNRYPATLFLILVFVFLLAPLVLVVLFSFHKLPRLSFPFSGASLRWYREVLGDPLVIRAFGRTALAAAVSGVIAGLLGFFAALGVGQVGPRARALILVIAMVPLVFPLLLYAIGLAVFYHSLGVGFSLWATIAGHVVVALPFVFLVLTAAMERFRFSLLEAAHDLGASKYQAFTSVTVPILLPAVLGAMLLAMAISVDEFIIAFFTAGQQKTLPLLMYGRINLGIEPSLNAIGTLLLMSTMILAFFSARKSTL